MAKGPQYSDSTDVIRLLRVATWFGPACFVMLSGLWYFMWDKGWISGGVFVFLLILNVPITIGAIFVIHHAVGEASVLLVKTIFADGDIAPPPTYPRQDVLIVQGKYADAADCFREMIAKTVRRVRILALDDQHVLAWVRRWRRNVPVREDRFDEENGGLSDGVMNHEDRTDGDRHIQDKEEDENAARDPSLVPHEIPKPRQHDEACRAQPRRHAQQANDVGRIAVLGAFGHRAHNCA